MAEEFTPVATLDELADGAMKMVKIGKREILLARVGDKVYATQNRCPHMRGNLSRGKLEGSVVTCPAHGKRYDLSNGHTIGLMSNNPLTRSVSGFFSGGGLATYPVKVDDGQVLVAVKNPAVV
jgi:3-phenylpropionate/trans-cinnamate dioxygenase ferredoxin component